MRKGKEITRWLLSKSTHCRSAGTQVAVVVLVVVLLKIMEGNEEKAMTEFGLRTGRATAVVKVKIKNSGEKGRKNQKEKERRYTSAHLITVTLQSDQ